MLTFNFKRLRMTQKSTVGKLPQPISMYIDDFLEIFQGGVGLFVIQKRFFFCKLFEINYNHHRVSCSLTYPIYVGDCLAVLPKALWHNFHPFPPLDEVVS